MPKNIIVSVKAGEKIGVAMIRDFAHVIDREKAALGLFITLAEPTRAMKEEAAAFGFYQRAQPCFSNYRYCRSKACSTAKFALATQT